MRLHSAREDRTRARDKRERTRSPPSSRTSRKASGKATPRVARKQTSPHVLTSKEAHAIWEEAVIFGILQTVFLTKEVVPKAAKCVTKKDSGDVLQRNVAAAIAKRLDVSRRV